MKPELTLAGIPRLEDPPFATDAEHKAAKGNPAHKFVAVDRVVMQGQVMICRAPSHEKAKKLAKMLNAWHVVVASLARLVELNGDHDPKAIAYGKFAMAKAEGV